MLIRTGDTRDWRTPTTTVYKNEQELEDLLFESPSLLQIDPVDPPLLAVRQVPAAGGAVDLVTVGRGGSIAVIECKLERNPEIRRKVVGQLLAYASWYWQMSYDDFAKAMESAMPSTDALEDAVQGLLPAGDVFDREAFRGRVSDNLASGSFTLVFAVDQITEELRRIVRYLDAQSGGDVRVVAVQFRYVREGAVEVLVPTTYGAELSDRGQQATTGKRRWDVDTFIAELAATVPPEHVAIARSILDWMAARDVGPHFGSGASRGDAYARTTGSAERPMALFSVLTWGKVEVHFEELQHLRPFDREQQRLALWKLLVDIPGVSIREEQAIKATWPTFSLAALETTRSRDAFTAAMDWALDEIRRATQSGGIGGPP